MGAPMPVIINGAAGLGHTETECDNLKALFRAMGVETRILPARSGEDLRVIAERVAQEKPAAIVAGGGDGTISAVASVLAGSDIPLGVLPLGTLNHFAKDLHIPLDITEAARTIVAGRAVNVDVGEVNGQVFINNSSLGLYPHIVLERRTQQRRLGRSKWSALFWATLTVLRRSSFLHVRLRLEDEERLYRAPLVFLGNNVYKMEGFNIGTRERLDTGILSIYVTQRRGRLRLLGLAARALFGRLHQARDFEALTAHTVEITTRRKLVHVAIDGEVAIMGAPLRYRIRPRDLRVIVPALDPGSALS